MERENQQMRREATEARALLAERARLEREQAHVRAARRAYMKELRRRREEQERRRGPE